MAKKNSSDFIDFNALLKQYLSKWYLFVISVVFCAVLAFLYTRGTPTEYAVRANVLITKDNPNPMADLGGLGALFGADGNVDDEIFILSSHSLYKDVAKDLGINVQHTVKTGFMRWELAYPEYPVDVTTDAAIIDTLRTGIKFKIKVDEQGKADIEAKIKRNVVAEVKDATLPATVDTPLGKFVVSTTKYYVPGEDLSTRVSVNGYDAAAEELDKNVVDDIPNKRSNVIQMAIDTPNPEYGKDILNEIVKKYNLRGIAEKNAQSTNTAKFIDDRLALLTTDLAKSEKEIQDYKQRKGIVDVQAEAVYQSEKKGKLEEALLTAETQSEVLKMTQAFVANPANAYSLIPLSIDNKSLQAAVEAYNELVLKRMELLNNAKPNNSVLKGLSAQIDAMRGNVSESLAKAAQSSDISVRDLRREKAAADARLGDIPTQEREYLDMKRQQTVKQELYIFLLQRREETGMLLANAVPKGSVIDEAYTLSEPLGLSNKMLIAIAMLLGLFLPPFYLYIRKILRNRFETRQDVEAVTDVPILGEMCIDRSGNSLVVTASSNSSASELFRLMRSNLTFILNDPNDKVVLMTSSTSGEGKSFISINLAASLALLGKKVLLVGLDIRKPRLAEYLGVSPKFGITQYLSSDSIGLDQIVAHNPEGVSGLDVICAGPVPPNPAELLSSPKVDGLFAELRTMYDYIIVDTAPIGLVSDTFTLDRISDASIYVCRVNHTPLSDLRLVNEISEQHRLKKLSLVINGSAAHKRYGYGNDTSK